jgi:hypothetical protein
MGKTASFTVGWTVWLLSPTKTGTAADVGCMKYEHPFSDTGLPVLPYTGSPVSGNISLLGFSVNGREQHRWMPPSRATYLQHSHPHSSQGVPQHAPPQAHPPHVQPLPQQLVVSMLTSFSCDSLQAPAEAPVIAVAVGG